MASPHVAGLAAYFLGLYGPKTPAEIDTLIKELSTQGVITGLPADTVNAVAFNGATE
jgi:subtilisin family serine protease